MRPLLYAYFFVSGAAALVYEVAWVRVLSVTFGNTVYAVSTVLTVFMAGLALGSYGFGRWIDRGGHALRVYGLLEMAIGTYAALFAWCTPALQEAAALLLHGTEASRTTAYFLKFLLAAAVLLPPTTLMGATLPVLAKWVTESSRTAGARLGALYGINTLGAVAGCLLEAYVLILMVGVRGSIVMAAAANVMVGIAAWALAGRTSGSTSAAASDEPVRRPVHVESSTGLATPSDVVSPSDEARGLLYSAAFGSGFLTLAVEVLWTRLFVNFLTGNVLIYATILGAFLAGIALGSLIVARFVDRLARLDRMLAFVMLASAAWLVASAVAQRGLEWLFQTLHEWGRASTGSTTAYVCLAAMFVVVAIPAATFGAVFPLLFRWAARSLDTLGRDLGRLYAANTLGAIAGSFVAGFALIALVGVNGSLLLLGAAYAGLAALVARGTIVRGASVAAAIVCLVMAATPSLQRPVFWFNGGFTAVTHITPEHTLFLKEGVEGTVGVALFNDVTSLSVNGVIVAESSQNDLWDLLLKAHLPMMLHESPKRVALVGLGAGVSLGAVESYDVVQHIDCIELSRDVVPAHREFARFNDRCWEDPRLHLWINDGRHFLMTTDRRYDVISVDPIDPPVCNQYTQDFFQLCHDRLDDGGLMVQWVPLFHLSAEHIRVATTAFRNVFEHASLWYDGTSILLIGRRGGPLVIDVERFKRRANEPRVLDNLSSIGYPRAPVLLATYVGGREAVRQLAGGNVPANTDDFPYLEYALLLAGPLDAQDFADNLELLVPLFEPFENVIRPEDRTPENLAELRRMRRLMQQLLQVRIRGLRSNYLDGQDQLRDVIEEFQLHPADLELLRPFVEG